MTPPYLALYASSAFASTKSERWMTRAGVWGSPPVGDSAFGGIPCASGGVRDEGNRIQLRPPRGLRLFPLDDVALASSVTAIKRKQPVATRPAEFLSLVEHRGFEPLTYRLRTYRSTN